MDCLLRFRRMNYSKQRPIRAASKPTTENQLPFSADDFATILNGFARTPILFVVHTER